MNIKKCCLCSELFDETITPPAIIKHSIYCNCVASYSYEDLAVLLNASRAKVITALNITGNFCESCSSLCGVDANQCASCFNLRVMNNRKKGVN